MEATALREAFSRFKRLPEGGLRAFLLGYGSAEVVERLVGVVDPAGLAAALSYVEAVYGSYGRPRLGYLADEKGDPFAARLCSPGSWRWRPKTSPNHTGGALSKLG